MPCLPVEGPSSRFGLCSEIWGGCAAPAGSCLDNTLALGWRCLRPLEMEVLLVVEDGGAHGHWGWRYLWPLMTEVPMAFGDFWACLSDHVELADKVARNREPLLSEEAPGSQAWHELGCLRWQLEPVPGGGLRKGQPYSDTIVSPSGYGHCRMQNSHKHCRSTAELDNPDKNLDKMTHLDNKKGGLFQGSLTGPWHSLWVFTVWVSPDQVSGIKLKPVYAQSLNLLFWYLKKETW